MMPWVFGSLPVVLVMVAEDVQSVLVNIQTLNLYKKLHRYDWLFSLQGLMVVYSEGN